MVKNLAKSPLLAVFYAALIWFAAALLPYSQGYLDAMAGGAMPLLGFVILVGYALWVMVAVALAYTSRSAGGVRFLVLLLVSMVGSQWAGPMLQAILRGERTGFASRMDLLLLLGAMAGATILVVVLSLFLYRNPERAPANSKPEPAKARYKINILGLVIRVLVLPIIFVLMYYLLWYFLLWQSDAVREFYGQTEKLTFMEEIINILLNNGADVIAVLLRGLAYALFGLALLFLLPGKRVMFIITNAMLVGSGAILFLIPSALLPEAVRLPHLIEGAALLIPFGGIAGILLHTAIRQEKVAEAAPAPKAAPAQGKRPAAPLKAPPAAIDKQA
jgi:hypothetical protein